MATRAYPAHWKTLSHKIRVERAQGAKSDAV